MDTSTIARNKAVVTRFNREVIERGDEAAFRDLVALTFVNRTAPQGSPPGPDGMLSFINTVLRPALSDLRVDLHEQVAEGDLVTTRKTIRGTHTGALFGVEPTRRAVAIDVIDVVRVRDGKYVEHWGVSTLPAILAELARG
jgi:predicted ester cyclase